MSEVLIVGVISALSGFVVAGVTAFLNRKTQQELSQLNSETQHLLVKHAQDLSEESQHRHRVFESLEWFESGTRRRSLGLAVVSANWDLMPDMHELWTNILVTQAVYLLSEAKRRREAHEAKNLANILDLLGKSDVDQVSMSSIRAALDNRDINPEKGIDINSEEFAKWEKFCEP
ncbi:Uncharacterised protein [Halioglobus japonicus]|nr:Uncharacterised protein [Halioglobus japonicus]